jgi:hypothetical protein
MYFLPKTTGVSKVVNPMIALAPARTNHRTATSNCTRHVCRYVPLLSRFVVIIYRGTTVFLCGVSFISIVEPQ